MYLKLFSTTAAAASLLPAANAIYDPNAEPPADGVASKAAPTLMMMGEDTVPPADGTDVSITNLMVPIDESNDTSPRNDGEEVSITTTLLAKPIRADSRGVKPGPTWTATKYYDTSKEELVNVAEGSTITLEVEDDGRFDGNAGCNNYFGSYGAAAEARSAAEPDPSITIVGPVGTTMMYCDGLMEQESAYLANFKGTIKVSASQDESILELRDAENNRVIAEYTTFTPLILDQEWAATGYYNSEEGALVDVIPDSGITLQMGVDETSISGNAGCNAYTGAYDDLTSASFVVSGPISFTEKYCDEPEHIMEQERLYLQNFEGGRSMKWDVLDDGTLELRDADSNDVLALYSAGLGADAGTLPAASDMEDEDNGSSTIGTFVAASVAILVMAFV